MAVLGFTTVTSLIKEQSEAVKAKGLESFGVSVIDDAEGKHDAIGSSNAQLHLFMQMKRGNITHMLFQTPEQAEVFFKNIETYYGKEKADKVTKDIVYISLEEKVDALDSRGLTYETKTSFEEAISSLE